MSSQECTFLSLLEFGNQSFECTKKYQSSYPEDGGDGRIRGIVANGRKDKQRGKDETVNQKVRSEWQKHRSDISSFKAPVCHVDGSECCRGPVGKRPCLGDERDGIRFPPLSFCCSAHRENNNRLQPPLPWLYQFHLSIHQTRLPCSFRAVNAISPFHPPTSAVKRPAPLPNLGNLAGLISVHLSAIGTSRIISARATNIPLCGGSCQVSRRHGNHAKYDGRPADICRAPRGIRARRHSLGTGFVFVRDKSKQSQSGKPAKKRSHIGFFPSAAAARQQVLVWSGTGCETMKSTFLCKCLCPVGIKAHLTKTGNNCGLHFGLVDLSASTCRRENCTHIKGWV